MPRKGSDGREEPTTVVHLPVGSDRNRAGYVGLLCASLRQVGINASADLSLRECLRADRLDAVHLHWLEYIVELDPAPRIGVLRSLIRAGRFTSSLIRLRRRGVRIVWTAHNLRPHEPRRPLGEALLATFVALVAHRVIVHSHFARRRLRRRLPGLRNVVVIPHGHYIGAFPEPSSPLQPERDEPFTFLCFGQIRPYKQLPGLIRAFRALPDVDVRLLVVGKPVVASELEALHEATGGDHRVVIDARLIPDEEVAALHRGADAAIFAYREVFSSGALLLALSYGLPVVAPMNSSAPELVLAPGLECFAPGELSAALSRMLEGERRAQSEAALRSAMRYPWSEVAHATAALYQPDHVARSRTFEAALADEDEGV